MPDNRNTFNAWIAMSIKGEDIGYEKKKAIKSVEIEEDDSAFDTCTIKIEDPDYKFISDDLFVEDVPMGIDMGFHSGTPYKKSFYGYIASIDIDFPESGVPTIELFCVDKSHLMNRVKNSRSWDNCSNSDIIIYFANNYGFNYYIEPDYNFEVKETISQSNQTDIEFMQSLAEDEIQPFICKLIGDTIYYVKRGMLSKPVRSLSYKQYPFEIQSFKPQINKETKEMEYKYVYLTTDKLVDIGLADNIRTARDVQGYPVDTSDVPFGAVSYHEDTGAVSESVSQDNTAKDEADKQMIAVEQKTLTGEVVLRPFQNCLGLQICDTVIINGVGNYLSGLYYISGIKRTLSAEGFSQNLTVLKNGFGDSLKLPDSALQLQNPEDEPLQLSAAKPIETGSTVRICDWAAKWGGEDEGVIVPAWIKDEELVVEQIDGEMCFLQPIGKWIHISYLTWYHTPRFELQASWTDVASSSTSA